MRHHSMPESMGTRVLCGIWKTCRHRLPRFPSLPPRERLTSTSECCAAQAGKTPSEEKGGMAESEKRRNLYMKNGPPRRNEDHVTKTSWRCSNELALEVGPFAVERLMLRINLQRDVSIL